MVDQSRRNERSFFDRIQLPRYATMRNKNTLQSKTLIEGYFIARQVAPSNIVFLFGGDGGSYSYELPDHSNLKCHAIISVIQIHIIIYGGELIVHKYTETLGDIIKSARERADLTVEAIAYKVGITERYLYRIENEGKKPSYDVLYKLIRELSISPDLIFYPEKPTKDSEIENLLRMLSDCDERSLEVVKAILKTLIETAKSG